MKPIQKGVPFNMELLAVQSERESSHISFVRRRKKQLRIPHMSKRETLNNIRTDLRKEREREKRKREREKSLYSHSCTELKFSDIIPFTHLPSLPSTLSHLPSPISPITSLLPPPPSSFSSLPPFSPYDPSLPSTSIPSFLFFPLWLF